MTRRSIASVTRSKTSSQSSRTGDASPLATTDAFGWLYVAEGSNLSAAFLLKEAVKIGLSETFGARHLAGTPEGRGLHWHTFTAALDAVPLFGAEDAFRRVHLLVSTTFTMQAVL